MDVCRPADANHPAVGVCHPADVNHPAADGSRLVDASHSAGTDCRPVPGVCFDQKRDVVPCCSLCPYVGAAENRIVRKNRGAGRRCEMRRSPFRRDALFLTMGGVNCCVTRRCRMDVRRRNRKAVARPSRSWQSAAWQVMLWVLAKWVRRRAAWGQRRWWYRQVSCRRLNYLFERHRLD